MSIKFKKSLLSGFLGLIIMVGSISIVGAAMNWINPTATPPDNGDIIILKADGNDGLGNHIATQDVNMTDASGAHRIYNIGSTGADRALVATTTVNNLAALIKAQDNHGAYIRSSSGSGDPAVSARNLGTGYALIASSTLGWAAQFGQSLQLATTSGVAAQLQWNAGSANILTTANNLVLPATKNLYWSSKALCDITNPTTEANCGRIVAGTGDNLGNHTAQYNLNMQSNATNFALINLQNKIGTTLATSSLQLSHTGSGAEVDPGLHAIAKSTHGIVAINTIQTNAVAAWGHNKGVGYGVVGRSLSGPGMSLYGRLTLLTETANATKPQLTFGAETEYNSLSLQAAPVANPAAQNLYWGDSLLCDTTKNNCGWSTVAAGGSSYWNLIGGNLFTDNLVSIGGVGQQAKLELQTPDMDAVSYIRNSHTSKSIAIDVQGDKAYLLLKDFFRTYHLDANGIGWGLGSIFMGTSYQAGLTRDMKVVGKYAYIANQNLTIIDISDPNAVNPPKTSINIGGGLDSIYISGNRAYVTGGLGTDFGIVDITNPLSPTIIYSGSLFSIPSDIEVSGDYAYVATQSGLSIVDIKSAIPSIVGTYSTNRARSVKVRGSIVYLTTGDDPVFYSIDVSDPTSPQLLDSVLQSNITNYHGVEDLFIAGDYAYLIERTFSNPQPDHDVTILDISDPTAIGFVGSREYDLGKGLIRGFLYGHTLIALSFDTQSHITEQFVNIGLPGADFDTLEQGFSQVDDIIVAQDLTADNMYVKSGLSIGGDMNITNNVLSSGAGLINIDGLKLDKSLLQKLITWSDS